jgi:hypothetical protein
VHPFLPRLLVVCLHDSSTQSRDADDTASGQESDAAVTPVRKSGPARKKMKVRFDLLARFFVSSKNLLIFFLPRLLHCLLIRLVIAVLAPSLSQASWYRFGSFLLFVVENTLYSCCVVTWSVCLRHAFFN